MQSIQISSFDVLTSVMFQDEVFWFVTPCGVCDRIPTFRRYVLHPSSDDSK